MIKWPVIVLVILAFVSCTNKEKEQPLFTLMQHTGIDFSNNIYNTPDFNIFSYRNFYNGGGCAIGDLNNDGLPEVFFTSNMGQNKLYLNKGDWKFEDISAKAGFVEKKDWSTGVVFVDINNDGWLDIFVCNAGYIDGQKPRCQLFINNQDLSFTEKASEYGLTNEGGYTTHAAFFDYDLDGDLDCFIINNSFIPVNTFNYANKRSLRAPDWPVADFLKGGGDHLYRNDGGKFIDVSKEAGIFGSLISFGLGVTVGDVNGDHYPDIYVSNDFFERDYLYINQKNGSFRDELEQWTQHISHSSMGADMADINNDGYPDIFTTDMLPDDDYRLKTTTSFDNIDVLRLKQKSGFYNQYTQNTLQVNNQDGNFFETAFFSGVAASDWSWGGLIFDADNDGLSDIFVCNGIYNDVTNQDFIDFFANDVIQSMVMTGKKEQFDEIINKMPSQAIPNKFYKNQGGLRFADAATITGLGQPSFSNGSAYGDLDNDGDLDLVVSNVNQPSFVYRNESREQNGNNYISIELKGTVGNTYAVGSKILVYQDSQVINREVIPTRGFQSSVDYKQVIGLGKGIADSMIIIWPDRTKQKLNKPAINTLHKIVYTKGQPLPTDSLIQTGTLLFQTINPVFESHREDEFIDFYNERNIPVMLSREGPAADTADVNGDGQTDIFIGGASGQAGQLYIRMNDKWSRKVMPAFEMDKAAEDVTAHFFDCDNDGDKDLFVGSGGNIYPAGNALLHHRLYINDGKGNFTSSPGAFPSYGFNTAVAVSYDIDNDNDLDIFVGTRSIPQDYGSVPESFIYLNDGKGRFTIGSSLKIGMVKDAVFAEITGDKIDELIVVGEWMAPSIYNFTGGKFTAINNSLGGMKGWWQSVAASDLDGDGIKDLVLGNIGENCYIQPGETYPVRLWISDFDQNGTQDKIITRNVKGKDVPVFLKRELTEQMPSLKKQNLKFEDYAVKSVQDLFTREAMAKASVYEFNYATSCIALNKGNGNFNIVKMPLYAQLSCINSILCRDVNGDNRTDLIMGGNQFYFQPQFGRLDASFGHVILNGGNNQWNWQKPSSSGLKVMGLVKKILAVSPNEFIIVQNNDQPYFFKTNQ